MKENTEYLELFIIADKVSARSRSKVLSFLDLAEI